MHAECINSMVCTEEQGVTRTKNKQIHTECISCPADAISPWSARGSQSSHAKKIAQMPTGCINCMVRTEQQSVTQKGNRIGAHRMHELPGPHVAAINCMHNKNQMHIARVHSMVGMSQQGVTRTKRRKNANRMHSLQAMHVEPGATRTKQKHRCTPNALPPWLARSSKVLHEKQIAQVPTRCIDSTICT